MSENPTDKMKSFLEDQKAKIEQAFNSSLEEAYRMKDSVNNYVGEQQRKLSTDFSGYVENMKESGRKVMDTWSYLPGGDMGARMESPDVVLSVPAMITRQGYTCETHLVESQGYLLNIHRIPRSKRGGAIPKKTILLQHGLFASSADWVMNGPERALGYVLADAGYDVWMTNVRGNKYAKEHAWLRTDSKTYWNFSWHDVALYDVPAVIDYILKVKGEGTKISYLGHSMGTTILFAMLSLRPEYNKILTSGYALAPIAFLTEMKSPLKNLAPVAANVAYMEMLYGSHEFLPKNSAIGKLTQSCEVDNIDSYICKNIVFYICGYNEKQFNKTLLPVFMAHFGTGTSWKTPVHFAQGIVSGGKFQQFDYGSYGNQRMYGDDTPPEYDLSKITLPIRMFWAQNDLLSSEKDVKLLYEKLPSSAKIHMMEDPEFNHIDYLMAIDAAKLLNNKIKEWLDEDFKSTDFSFSFKFSK